MRACLAALALFAAGCRPSTPGTPAPDSAGVAATGAELQPGSLRLSPDLVVMTAAQADTLSWQCSRRSYEGVTGFDPPRADLARLDADLDRITPLARATPGVPPDFDARTSVRQVVGVVLPDGRRRLYVNAYARPDTTEGAYRGSCSERPTRPCIVCDGGPDFWGVLYDPATRTFSEFDANGSA